MSSRFRPGFHRSVTSTVVLACASVAVAQWQAVAPGIEYQDFTVSGPNNVFVVRMDRSHPDCTIDSMLGQDRLLFGTETTSSMAEGYEDTIGYWGQSWGQRYDVVAAINGDFYNNGLSVSGQIQSGWYAKRFEDFTGGSGFAWQLDGDAFIGGCVRHRSSKQVVNYPATGQSQNISGINRARGGDELIVYTHHYNFSTATDPTGVEVLVQMQRPTLILPTPAAAVGTVVAVHDGAGGTVIPFDHVVLSATGGAAAKLLANAPVGAEVRISQEVTHYEHDCSTGSPWDWTKTYASIGGSYHFLDDGVVQFSTDPGALQRHPRTAVALNDDHVFFVVVDGRSAISIGMNMTELGNFCLNTLGATEGINQDGGGSSTLWVDGQVMNVPSDGQERPVANGLMMVVVQPMEQSVRYAVGQAVRTSANVSVRVGPGANYGFHDTVALGTTGTVLAHNLTGVRASGTNWWWCDFAGTTGWYPATALLELECAGDYDGSGWVDAGDIDQLAFCMTGPGNTLSPGHVCLAGDVDFDDEVDVADVAAFQRCFVGM